MKVAINVNDMVSVKVTEEGRNVYNSFRGNRSDPRRVKEGDIITCTMWEIMSIFGSSFEVGSKSLFVNNNLYIINKW